MNPEATADALPALLAQPVVWVPVWIAATLVGAGLISLVVRRQLEAFGLPRGGRSELAWPRLFGSGAGWAALLLSARGLCEQLGLLGLASAAGDLLGLLLSLVPGAAILAGTSAYVRARTRAAEDRGAEALRETEATLRHVPLAAGALAAVSVIDGLAGLFSSALWVVALAGLALALSPELREKAAALRDDLLAGPSLARRARVGEPLALPDGPLTLMGPPGFTHTWVKDGGEPVRMGNAALLARMPPTGSEPRS